ncbi:MAG: sel1 repeat family protein [Peptococcaceae bacterium]|nr:sel1 repeat family protein [Peptococcaceae bacterium]
MNESAFTIETRSEVNVTISEDLSIDFLDLYIETCNANMVFTNQVNEILEMMISVCPKDLKAKIKSLSERERSDHSPKVQNELALSLLCASDALRRYQFPESPVCQWLLEEYRSPALFWAVKAVEQNYTPAYNTERMIIQQGARDVQGNIQLARALTFSAAKKGDLSAQDVLGFSYGSKDSDFNMSRLVEYNLAKSEYWYKRMEESADPKRFELLAKHYTYSNPEKAIYFIENALGQSADNHKYYVNLTECLCRINRLKECKDYVEYIAQNESAEICYNTYVALHDTRCKNSQGKNVAGWIIIDDIDLELSLLHRAASLNHEKAQVLLRERYKKTFMGAIKRSKTWNNFI